MTAAAPDGESASIGPDGADQLAAAAPPMPAVPPIVPGAPPAVQVAAPAKGQTVVAGLQGMRGRILVIEGGDGSSGRRPWARGGAGTQTPVLSAMLAAVSPQILLAADAVDAVHLPGAVDAQSVLAHLRAAARHPGPLLIHIGGHLVTDRRAEQLFLTLRDSKPADSLPWQALAAELGHRPAEWDTLVIADLSADQAAWPLVSSAITPLVDGIPVWAVVHPDPDRIGILTQALIEALHRGRPGAEAVLAPEQLRQQVHSVLRPDAVTITAHAPNRPIFRNTARQIGSTPAEPRPYDGPRPAAVNPKPPKRVAKPDVRAPQPAKAEVQLRPGAVSLVKAGVPPTPKRPVRPVSLVKAAKAAPPREPEPTTADPLADYREAIGSIVRSAEAGEHQKADGLAQALEETATAAHGATAPVVLQVRQVRAHVSRLAGRPAVAAEIYREVAVTLLRTRGPEHPETQQVATNAEACWRSIADPAVAIELAPEIIELRAYLPGPDGRKLRAAERYLKQLATAKAEA